MIGAGGQLYCSITAQRYRVAFRGAVERRRATDKNSSAFLVDAGVHRYGLVFLFFPVPLRKSFGSKWLCSLDTNSL